MGTRSIKTCLIDLWLLHVYMLISTFWSAAWCANSLSYRHITLELGPTRTTLKNLCLWWYCKFKKIRRKHDVKGKDGSCGADICHSKGHMSQSHVDTLSWKRRPEGSLPLFPFTPCLLFVSAAVTSLAGPTLHAVYKAEVGRIWLKDIKFCTYFIWIKVDPRELGKNCHCWQYICVNCPQMPGCDASCCFFGFFFLRSLNRSHQAGEA